MAWLALVQRGMGGRLWVQGEAASEGERSERSIAFHALCCSPSWQEWVWMAGRGTGLLNPRSSGAAPALRMSLFPIGLKLRMGWQGPWRAVAFPCWLPHPFLGRDQVTFILVYRVPNTASFNERPVPRV